MSGQKDEDITLVLTMSLHDRAGSHLGTVAFVGLFTVTDLYVKHPPLALHQRGLQGCTEGRGIYRGRHDNQPQLGPQQLLHLAGECQGGIGSEAALMKLVEDHDVDTVKGGILDQHTGENAFGHHLDAGITAHLGLKPHAITHRLANGFTEHGCHTGGYLAGGYTARFEHHNLALRGQLLQHRQREKR